MTNEANNDDKEINNEQLRIERISIDKNEEEMDDSDWCCCISTAFGLIWW